MLALISAGHQEKNHFSIVLSLEELCTSPISHSAKIQCYQHTRILKQCEENESLMQETGEQV